jgi:hypothetical protein
LPRLTGLLDALDASGAERLRAVDRCDELVGAGDVEVEMQVFFSGRGSSVR